MFGALVRLVVILIVLAAGVAFFMGYRVGDRGTPHPATQPSVGTPERRPVDTSKARETGAAVGEKVAVGANAAEHALESAALTGKIKAKMALDDTVKAAAIDIENDNGVITLKGTVRSEAERARAVQLARETAGVTSVNDRLTVR
ncbi:MAG: hyperosmotically inducible periplasmic protein [Acidobacteriota bacterium]|jgi:osmotically-inducible protein OsmY